MRPARLISPHSALLALALSAAPRLGAQGFHVERLRTEYATNPIGIDAPTPRMSWTLHAERRATRQSAYELRVAPTTEALASAALWSSGKVTSDESVNRVYGGPRLEPGRRYFWQVRAWYDRGAAPPWSEPAYWE